MRGIYTLFAVLSLAGCAVAPPKVTLQNQFKTEDHAKYLSDGANVVRGQAFLRQRGGGTVTCAGSRAILLPATPYYREATDAAVRGSQIEYGENKPSKDQGVVLLRETRCDAQGNFEFEKVPNGRYILMSEVQWTVGSSRQGGMVRREVDVSEGKTNRFLLSDNDRLQ